MTAGGRPDFEIWLVDLVGGEEPLHALDAAHRLLPEVPEAGPQSPEIRLIGNRKRTARIALRAILSRHRGAESARLPFAIASSGKPGLHPASGREGLEFSLAHCETTALIAVSTSGPVGVDVEAIRPVRINSERRAMLEAAAAGLCPSEPLPDGPDDRRFLQAWVRLEALAKATGEGVSALLGRLGVRGRNLLAPMEDDLAARPMLVRDLTLANHSALHAAVAGTSEHLAPVKPCPVVRSLPLDPAWLDAMVRAGVGTGPGPKFSS